MPTTIDIYRKLDNMLRKGELDRVNLFLRHVNLDAFSDKDKVGILRITFPTLYKLPDWGFCAIRVRKHLLRTRSKKEVEELLRGLIDPLE